MKCYRCSGDLYVHHADAQGAGLRCGRCGLTISSDHPALNSAEVSGAIMAHKAAFADRQERYFKENPHMRPKERTE